MAIALGVKTESPQFRTREKLTPESKESIFYFQAWPPNRGGLWPALNPWLFRSMISRWICWFGLSKRERERESCSCDTVTTKTIPRPERGCNRYVAWDQESGLMNKGVVMWLHDGELAIRTRTDNGIECGWKRKKVMTTSARVANGQGKGRKALRGFQKHKWEKRKKNETLISEGFSTSLHLLFVLFIFN